jgi:membrane-associated phospholipid phosphatase
MPSFSDLVTPLAADFRRFASDDNLMIASLGLGGAFATRTLDPRLSLGDWGEEAAEAFGPGRVAGSAIVQGGAAFATYLTGRLTNQPRVARVGAKLVRAQIVAQTTTQVMKFAVQRTRPDGTRLSFPSGHTSASFATATVLQEEFGWKVGVPAYAAAAWIGASRMQSRKHFLSDVITGATIGILAGRSVTFSAGASRFAVTPVAVPGGAGVNVVSLDLRRR